MSGPGGRQAAGGEAARADAGPGRGLGGLEPVAAGLQVQLHVSRAGPRPPDDEPRVRGARVRGRGQHARPVRGRGLLLPQARHALPVRLPDVRELPHQQTVRYQDVWLIDTVPILSTVLSSDWSRYRDAADLDERGPGPRVQGGVPGPRLLLPLLHGQRREGLVPLRHGLRPRHRRQGGLLHQGQHCGAPA